MAAGALQLGQGDGVRADNFLGYAVGVTKDFSGTPTVITGSDEASLISALENGGERIIIGEDVTFDINAVINVAGGTQLYCPTGPFYIETYGVGGTEPMNITADDCFFGNIIMRSSAGNDQQNNPGGIWDLTDTVYTNGIYFFHVGHPTHANVSGLNYDGPEPYQGWMNDGGANALRNWTMHGSYTPNDGQNTNNSKFATIGAKTQHTGMTNTHMTMYRGYSYSWTRAPSFADGGTLDMANWVQPNFADHQSAGIDVKRSALADVRACMIYGNEPALTFSTLSSDSEAQMYYVGVTGTPTGEESLEQGTLTKNWDTTGVSNPYATTRIGSYTGKPVVDVASTTLEADVLSKVAGSYAIMEEAPAGTLTPISGPHSSWKTFRNALPSIFYSAWNPDSQRVRETFAHGATFSKGIFVGRGASRRLVGKTFERMANYPGLYAPPSGFIPRERQSFAVGGF